MSVSEVPDAGHVLPSDNVANAYTPAICGTTLAVGLIAVAVVVYGPDLTNAGSTVT
jgi:hypothetical protein